MPADVMPLLVGAFVRAAVLLGAGWAVAAVMRQASASARHFCWTCAFAGAALVPVAAVVVPQWSMRSPASLATLASPAPPVGSRASQATDAGNIPAPSTVNPRPASTPPSSDRFSWPASDTAAIGIWALGVVGSLGYLAIGWLGSRRIRRSATTIDAPWVGTASTCVHASGFHRSIAFAESPMVRTPMVCGVWRPVMVLPREASEWSTDRVRVVVLHELAHIQRRDCLTQLLAQIVCAIHWFNPLAWAAARKLRAERERACDDVVLAAGIRGSEYAGHLLEIAQKTGRVRLSPLAAVSVAMAHRSQLEGRLMAILDPAVQRSSARHARALGTALILLFAIPLAAVRLETAVRPTAASVLAPAPAARVVATRPEPARIPVAGMAIQAPPASPAQSSGASQNTIVQETLDKRLIEFAEGGNLEGVSAMLAAGANVNAEIDGDGSPLIAAARSGHLSIVGMLLQRGANPNLIVDGDGSPLIAAADEGHVAIVDMLLQRGADPNLIAEGDGSPLIAAASRGRIDVIELLLQRGAFINQIAEGDETALIQASGSGYLNAVKLLVARGADVNAGVWARVSDRDGSSNLELRTPLSVARRNQHLDVVEYLRSAGAHD